MTITFINSSEKYHKEIDTISNFLEKYIKSFDYDINIIKLSEVQFAKCTECRCCTQIKGSTPVKCVIKDELNHVLDEIENADSYVILSDRRHLFKENKVQKKFSQRLVAYHYWPYGQVKATARKQFLNKSSILINYNTTKYFMNHSFYTSIAYLEHASNSFGAKVIDSYIITPEQKMAQYADKLKLMADELISTLKSVS